MKRIAIPLIVISLLTGCFRKKETDAKYIKLAKEYIATHPTDVQILKDPPPVVSVFTNAEVYGNQPIWMVTFPSFPKDKDGKIKDTQRFGLSVYMQSKGEVVNMAFHRP